MHEICTFCPEPDTLYDWLATGSTTDRILGGNGGYIGVFEARMGAYGGVMWVAITSPVGMPAGSTSGSWNPIEKWKHFNNLIIRVIKEKFLLMGFPIPSRSNGCS